MVLFPGNLCVLLGKEPSQAPKGQSVGMRFVIWMLRTFQPSSFHMHSHLPAAVLGSTFAQGVAEPFPLQLSRGISVGLGLSSRVKHSLTVVQRTWPDNSEAGWWKGRDSTGSRDGRVAPHSWLSREQTCSQGKIMSCHSPGPSPARGSVAKIEGQE